MNRFFRIGVNIKRLRELAGYTQGDLAAAINRSGFDVDIKQPYIAMLEKSKGEKLPSLSVLAAMSSVFHVSMDEICGFERTERGSIIDALSLEDKKLLLCMAARLVRKNDEELTAQWADLAAAIYDIGGRGLAADIESKIGIELPISDKELAILFE